MEIYIEKVKKEFNNKVLFEIENVTFYRKCITVLMGRNGIGKSTLFNILAGLDTEYKGDIKYNGHKLDKTIMKEMTLVSQKPYIFSFSVYDNLAYPLRLRKYPKREIDKLVNEYIEKFDLVYLKKQKGNSLSGGEMQRVSLARALIFSPKVLLLDEYTASIDQNSISKMEKIILDYREKEEANIILITHNKEQANRIGDRIINMG